MKIFFSEGKNPAKLVEIDPNVTQDEMAKTLVNNYGFKPGKILFIFNGKILKEKRPFTQLKDKNHVIVFSKQVKGSESAQKSAPSKEKASVPTQDVHKAEQKNETGMNDVIQNIIKQLNLEKIYDPENNIWDRGNLLGQISEIINNNPQLINYLYRANNLNSIPGVNMDYIFNTICLILDVQIADFSPFQDDIVAKEECMSKEQREIYNELVSEYKDKEKVIEALEKTSFDKEEAIKTLKA